MLDTIDLATEAEELTARLRRARCCDALAPCYRCSLMRFNVLARRRVLEVPPTPQWEQNALTAREVAAVSDDLSSVVVVLRPQLVALEAC
jgi:hypothetical protein